MPGEKKNLLGEAISSVCEVIRDNETGRCTRRPQFGSATALWMQNPRNLVRAATGPLTAASARKVSPSAFPTYFSGALDKL